MVKFDRFIFVDWSASAKPKKGKDSIWIASCTTKNIKKIPNDTFCDALACYEKGKNKKTHWNDLLNKDNNKENFLKFSSVANPPTRRAAVDFLKDILNSENKKTLIGFDFGFGYPHGAYKNSEIGTTWCTLWENLYNNLYNKDYKKKYLYPHFELASCWNGRHQLCFWGRHKGLKNMASNIKLKKHEASARMESKEGVKEFRMTEKCMDRGGFKSSQWQLCYSGCVGSQTLLGIPYAYELREYLNGNNIDTKVWPFETDFTKKFKGQVLICEVHFGAIPEVMLCVDKKVKLFKKNESHRLKNDYPKDRMQVEKMCQFFAKKNESDIKQLLEFKWDRFEKNEKDKITNKEGWILGVPLCSPPDRT